MDKIKFYGTRGSCSLTSDKYMEFGGATTCILFNLEGKQIMVDCGSGVNEALDDLKNVEELHLLISHSHLDHINGIPALLSVIGDKPLHIYGKAFNGAGIKDVIVGVMNISLWQIRPKTFEHIVFHDIEGDFKIGNVSISSMDSNHPGGCSIFRLDTPSDSIVTAFDFCHLDGYDDKLIKFAKGAKTLIYDGSFSESELKDKPTWGHSTPEAGAAIGEKLDCEKVYITHFGVYDDEQLTLWEKALKRAYPNVEFARSGNPQNKLAKMLEIGSMLGGEKDNDALLTKVVEASMDITSADGGTLYLLNDDKLDFKILVNRSKKIKLVSKNNLLQIPGVEIDGKNACAAAAREKKMINIPDCYSDKNYDFSGAKKYDETNNYVTKSVLVVPLVDDYDDVVGVLQLINATKNDKVVPFRSEDEKTVFALANQASMSIVNSQYSQRINDLLYGFVRVMSVGIDERTPYNVNHTKNMVAFAENFFDYEEAVKGKYNVDSLKRREILMAIWLHDIGKILTPMDIMNKDSRLGEAIKDVENRFDRRDLLLRLQCANKTISKKEYCELERERLEQFTAIRNLNKAGFLTADLKHELDEMASKKYVEIDGTECPILKNDEIYQLNIVRGTLNAEERKVMEDHVSLTQKFLSQLNFPKHFDQIPAYAGNHHEFLDGTGYPNHLTAKDLPWPCRFVTILDIYEALTAADRPYKKPFSSEQALSILREMGEKGKLDLDIIKEFQMTKAWIIK